MTPGLDSLSKEQDPFFLVQQINLKNTTNWMGSEIGVPRGGGANRYGSLQQFHGTPGV